MNECLEIMDEYRIPSQGLNTTLVEGKIEDDPERYGIIKAH